MDFDHKLEQYRRDLTSGDRGIDLYNTVKRNEYAERYDRTPADREFIENIEECTFSPKINDDKQRKGKKDRDLKAVKGFELAMKRKLQAKQQDHIKRLTTIRNPQ